MVVMWRSFKYRCEVLWVRSAGTDLPMNGGHTVRSPSAGLELLGADGAEGAAESSSSASPHPEGSDVANRR